MNAQKRCRHSFGTCGLTTTFKSMTSCQMQIRSRASSYTAQTPHCESLSVLLLQQPATVTVVTRALVVVIRELVVRKTPATRSLAARCVSCSRACTP